MDDLPIIATRLWDLVGRRPVPSKELVEALYARLHWFRPSEAEEVVSALLQTGLLLPGPDPGTVVGSRELDAIAVPLTYRPPPDLKLARGSSLPELLPRILARVAETSHEEVAKLRQEALALSASLGVWPEAGALLLAARRGISLPELGEELDRRLREGEGPR